MPVIYELQYEDNTTEVIRLPAEVWRKGNTSFTRVHRSDKKIIRIVLDPFLETADVDTENNYYPREEQISRFEIFKQNNQASQPNPMQNASKRVIKP